MQMAAKIQKFALSIKTEFAPKIIAITSKELERNTKGTIKTLVRRDGKPVKFSGDLETNVKFIPSERGVKVITTPYFDRFDKGYMNPAEPVNTPKFQQWYQTKMGYNKPLGSTSNVKIPHYGIIDNSIDMSKSGIKQQGEILIQRIANKAFS